MSRKTRAANEYLTAGPDADEVADRVADLFEGSLSSLAYAMLQPNPRLWLADHLDDLADDVGEPNAEQELRSAAAFLRKDP